MPGGDGEGRPALGVAEIGVGSGGEEGLDGGGVAGFGGEEEGRSAAGLVGVDVGPGGDQGVDDVGARGEGGGTQGGESFRARDIGGHAGIEEAGDSPGVALAGGAVEFDWGERVVAPGELGDGAFAGVGSAGGEPEERRKAGRERHAGAGGSPGG